MGKKANIWGDKWVPLPTTFAAHFPTWVLDHEAKVVELMDSDTYGWNRGLLEAQFSSKEVSAISSIAISPH
jgi:hypothetical protein